MSLSHFLKRAKKIEDDYKKNHDAEPQEEGHDESNWLVSYADMMTLLCAFFIMMFSLSTLNASQYEKVKKEVTEHLGGEYKIPHKEIQAEISQILEEKGIKDKSEIISDVYGTTVIFQSTLFFDSLSAYIKPAGKEIIQTIAKSVLTQAQNDHTQYRIMVEGHTDAQPIISGNYPSNWGLSSARATQVVRLFNQEGFHANQLTAIGFADTKPLMRNRTPAGNWNIPGLEKNRRVVIRIFNSSEKIFPWDTP